MHQRVGHIITLNCTDRRNVRNHQSSYASSSGVKNIHLKFHGSLKKLLRLTAMVLPSAFSIVFLEHQNMCSCVSSGSLPAAQSSKHAADRCYCYEVDQFRVKAGDKDYQTCVESGNIWPLTKKAKPGSRWQGEERCRRSVVWM